MGNKAQSKGRIDTLTASIIHQQPKQKPKTFKVLVMGPQMSGKTSLITRIQSDKFKQQYKATIGADFFYYQFQDRHSLQIWDTANYQFHGSLGKALFRHTKVLLVLSDLGKSFDSQFLSIHTKRFCQLISNVPVYLVGSKKDLSQQQYTNKEHQSYARKHGMIYRQTSAKNGEGVCDLFQEIKELCLNQLQIDNSII